MFTQEVQFRSGKKELHQSNLIVSLTVGLKIYKFALDVIRSVKKSIKTFCMLKRSIALCKMLCPWDKIHGACFCLIYSDVIFYVCIWGKIIILVTM